MGGTLNQGIITCRHVSNKDALWTFPLSSIDTYKTSDKEVKIPEVQQFIGVYNEKVWVRTNNGHFFALDINSGKLFESPKGQLTYMMLMAVLMSILRNGCISFFL